LDSTRDQLRQYYQDNYYLASQTFPITPQPTTTETLSGSPQKVNFTARYKKRPINLKDELEEYYRLPLEDFDTCDPIQWWAGRRLQFPNLSRLARDILAIPGGLNLFKPFYYRYTNLLCAMQARLSLSNAFFRVVVILFPFGVPVSNLTRSGH
jgi:hypothetical protein